jgi:hypothetical protein
MVGNGWIDGASLNPATFAPLGVRDEQLCISKPSAPAGTPGVGCCWRDLGVVDVQASIAVPPLSRDFREATPLLHVVPGTDTHGIGAWLSTYRPKSSLGFLLVGTMGNPVERFSALATATYSRDDAHHVLTIRSAGGELVVFYDDVELELFAHPSREPVTCVRVPSELRASTLHGVALDCHFEPPEAMDAPVVASVCFDVIS